MTIEAVFWDYDNTILETADAHFEKHKAVLAKVGIELGEILKQRIYENNGHQNWEWMAKDLGLKIPENVYLREIDLEFQKYILNLELRPGVIKLFEQLRKLGIPQAIVTNARKNSAKPVLDEKKIAPLMKFILFKEDYEGRKPEPTPYLLAFEKMEGILGTKLHPRNCLVIEDDPKGVESAHRAGAMVIHRKLRDDEEDCPYADFHCFHEDEFLNIVETLLKLKR